MTIPDGCVQASYHWCCDPEYLPHREVADHIIGAIYVADEPFTVDGIHYNPHQIKQVVARPIFELLPY